VSVRVDKKVRKAEQHLQSCRKFIKHCQELDLKLEFLESRPVSVAKHFPRALTAQDKKYAIEQISMFIYTTGTPFGEFGQNLVHIAER
jgi:hypothetical protein